MCLSQETSEWSEDEALAEAKELWGIDGREEGEVICHSCLELVTEADRRRKALGALVRFCVAVSRSDGERAALAVEGLLRRIYARGNTERWLAGMEQNLLRLSGIAQA